MLIRRSPRRPVWCHAAALLICLAWTPASLAQQPPSVNVRHKGDGILQLHNVAPESMTLNSRYGTNGYVIPTGRQLMLQVSDQFSWMEQSEVCTDTQAMISLTEVEPYAGQSIYRIDNQFGLLIWVGDVNRPPVPMRGNGWQTVFDNFCLGTTRGYTVVVQPVLLRQFPGNNINFAPPRRMKIGEIRLQRRAGARLQGQTSFSIYLDGSLQLRVRNINCEIRLPSFVPLRSVSRGEFDRQQEVMAGSFQAQLGCGGNSPAGFVLTDVQNFQNQSMVLRTAGTARGIGLRLYSEQGQPLRLGHDINGLSNRWPTEGAQSTQLQVRYAKTADNVTAGSVVGTVHFTVFYR